MAKRIAKKFIIFILFALALVAGGVYFLFFEKQENNIVQGEKDPHQNTIAPNNLNCGLSVAAESELYVSGTKQLKNNNLNPGDELEGEKIKIIGYAYSGAGKDDALANAKIEIWQADTYGFFYPADSGRADEFNAQDLRLRGFVRSDKFGFFEFTTIYPGGSSERARHIYLRASSRGHKPVTTQLIMSRFGDAVSIDEDPIAKKLPNCNNMFFGAIEGVPTAGYDFHLEGNN